MNDLNKWKRIQIITTGGTIEKTYDESDGTLFNRETVIKKKINEKLRLPYTEVIISSVLAKDSLDMNESDRQLICDRIMELHSLEDDPIVILHGTDTMQETAEMASKLIQNPKAPIIFTGAMKPLGFEDSDALQNVTEALICAQLVAPGIFISFHNRLFSVPGVRKNKVKKTFERF
ncbi:MAG: asparaginase [Halobacteriovoraceae bacterium]|nr:asparaginase [Halobacteriovoraceae bacterium]|tara:strand:+ start:1495 stop:2022 length:528 start_codon:yes stop_codon:yes gene_type:complete